MTDLGQSDLLYKVFLFNNALPVDGKYDFN